MYRRFTYARNGILLRYQYHITKLEEELLALDHEDELKASKGDAHAKARLISWRYNDFTPPTDPHRSRGRKQLFDLLEAALEKYDDLLQREHAIMSIQRCPRKMHKGLFDFVFNGKFVKAVVCMATTALLAVPIVVLYAMSVQGGSGWLKIGAFWFLSSLLSSSSWLDPRAGSDHPTHQAYVSRCSTSKPSTETHCPFQILHHRS